MGNERDNETRLNEGERERREEKQQLQGGTGKEVDKAFKPGREGAKLWRNREIWRESGKDAGEGGTGREGER